MRYFIILFLLLSCSKSEQPKFESDKAVITEQPEVESDTAVITEKPTAESDTAVITETPTAESDISVDQMRSCLYLSHRKAKSVLT